MPSTPQKQEPGSTFERPLFSQHAPHTFMASVGGLPAS